MWIFDALIRLVGYVVISIILDILIYTIGYAVAWAVLPLILFRKIHVEPLVAAGNGFNVFGYRYDNDGRIEMEAKIAGFIGFTICVFGFVVAGLLIHRTM